ncbi:MAG: globin [Pseudodonghicola sp.]
MRNTLPKVFAQKAALAERFFDTIFRHAPEMEAFFPRHYGRRKELFVLLLTRVALCAERPAALEGVAQQMARVHRPLGIRPVHYDIGAHAMIEAFETILSDRLSRAELDRWFDAIIGLTRRLAELAV